MLYCTGENGVGIKILDFIWRIRGTEKKTMIIFITDLHVLICLWEVQYVLLNLHVFCYLSYLSPMINYWLSLPHPYGSSRISFLERGMDNKRFTFIYRLSLLRYFYLYLKVNKVAVASI